MRNVTGEEERTSEDSRETKNKGRERGGEEKEAGKVSKTCTSRE